MSAILTTEQLANAPAHDVIASHITLQELVETLRQRLGDEQRAHDILKTRYEAVVSPPPVRLLPADDEVLWILGQPSFAVRHVAETLRLSGQDIPRKAEAEQAAALLWELNLWLEHGPEWRSKAQLRALEIIDAAKNAAVGGAS